MGVFEDEEDWGEEGYLRERGGRQKEADGSESSMGRKGGWEEEDGGKELRNRRRTKGRQYGGEWSQFQLRRHKANAAFLTLILRPPVFLMQMCLT